MRNNTTKLSRNAQQMSRCIVPGANSSSLEVFVKACWYILRLVRKPEETTNKSFIRTNLSLIIGLIDDKHWPANFNNREFSRREKSSKNTSPYARLLGTTLGTQFLYSVLGTEFGYSFWVLAWVLVFGTRFGYLFWVLILSSYFGYALLVRILGTHFEYSCCVRILVIYFGYVIWVRTLGRYFGH
jgi:hypothetical protein